MRAEFVEIGFDRAEHRRRQCAREILAQHAIFAVLVAEPGSALGELHEVNRRGRTAPRYAPHAKGGKPWRAAAYPLLRWPELAQRGDATMDEQVSPAMAAFARIPERNTGDNLLRTAQQHHVALSNMADTKANIIITVSSIVLTLSLGRMNDPDLRVSVLTLAGFTLVAQLLAILAVLPKYRPLKITGDKLPPNFNLLFFGHFSELSRERFLTEMTHALTPDGSPYAVWSNDIYSLGTYLSRYKYRYLRYSYLFFLTGFMLACLLQGWHMLTH
jgi:hypothetical protein